MAWTKEQENAINARGCSLLVSAAAGSGKTSVLVERLVRILSDSENRVPADRMIVVTFTRDAAAEMKQRLTAALAGLIEKDPENHWLNEQQLLLQSAKIATIHSFCFELIRDNVQELELTGSFRVMDETESSVMVSEAISDLVTEYYEKHPEMMNFLYDQFCFKDDSAIERLISDIYRFICSLPYGMEWLRKICRGYSPEGNACDEFLGEYFRVAAAKAETAEELAAECVSISAEGDIGEKAVDLLDSEYFAIEKARRILSDESRTPEKRAEEYACNTPLFGRLTMSKSADADIAERIKSLRKDYKAIVNEEISSCLEIVSHAREDIGVHFKVLTILEQMIRELDENLWKTKVEKSCIGFSDAETLTVKLLSYMDDSGKIVKSRLAHDLSDYYKVIMIDEFQDTNNNQDLIFRLLSHGGSPERAGDNLFMVGDVKQSIYRFRLANPKNFIDTMDSSVEYDENGSGENSYIRLNRNFRSSKDVIELVNFVFRSVMSREVGEIVYDSGEELVQGASFTERERKTEVAVLVTGTDDSTISQAAYTAEKIDSMLKNKVQVDNRDGVSTRDCTKKDFCILLRRKTDAVLYIEELAKLGITAYSEETAGYLSSREISVLLNLLRVVDNPLIDTSLAAVLMSPMFMFTDDEMVILRLENRKGYLYSSLCRIAESEKSEQISDVMHGKISRVLEVISELRMQSASMSLVELIRHIYDRTDFISVIRMYEDGEKKRANLRALLEYAGSYQESSDEGLGGFLRYIDRTVRMNGDFKQGQTVSASDDVVVIKTIHKSKGLEFPFVFLCETQVQFNRQDSLKNLQLNFESGIGFRLQNRREFKRFTTLPFEVINNRNRNDALSEEMRLLYVALTRAREQLFIPLELGPSQIKKLGSYAVKIHQYQGITPKISRSAKSMQDWLLMSLLTHRNGNLLRELSEYDMFFIEDTGFEINFTEVNAASETAEEEKTSDRVKAEPDPELTEKIRNMFSESRSNSRKKVQAKFSVSDISKDHDKFGIVLKRPSFASEKHGMTPSERGTVVHSILQHSEFAKLAENPEAEIKRAAECGFITRSQAEETDVQLIRNFICSDIFRRACLSPRVEKERKFLVKISDLNLDGDRFSEYNDTDCMVQGIIDLYFEEDDGIVLVDYKTDNVSDISVLAENYSTQLEIYKAALESIENKKVKAMIIYSLKLGSFIEVKQEEQNWENYTV